MDGDQRKQLESILENMKKEKVDDETHENGTPPASPPPINKSQWENNHDKSHNNSHGTKHLNDLVE